MKKHIYNKVYGAALLATLLLAAAACTNEMPLADNGQDPDNAKPEAGILTTVTVSQDAGAQTRLEYTDNATTMEVAWETGDVIYIGTTPTPKNQFTRESLTQAGFKRFVCETAEGNQATFKAAQGEELTNITPGTTLFALYANENNTFIEYISNESLYCTWYIADDPYVSNIKVEAQRQLSNGSPDHVAKHDCMYDYVTVSQQDEIPHFSFNRIFSLLKFTLQLPPEARDRKMTKLEFISSSFDYKKFINFLQNPSYLWKNLGEDSSIILHLGQENSDGVECDNTSGTPTLVAFLVFSEMDPNQTITLRVTDNTGNTYSTKMTSNLIRANHFYRGTYTLKPDVSQ